MTLQPGQQLDLLDASGRCLGPVCVERLDGNLVFGHFTPAPAFAALAPLFAAFVSAANDQLFSLVAELDQKIGALGLHLQGADAPAIHDVQIGDDRITFRLVQEADKCFPAPAVGMHSPGPAPSGSAQP